MPTKRSTAFAFMASAVWAGCATPTQTRTQEEDALSSTAAARFASRRPLEGRDIDTDEYGAPLDVRAAILLDGTCYVVTERPGRHVCVGGETLDFETTSQRGLGISFARAVFIGSKDKMTLYQAAEGKTKGDRYAGWTFEDDPAHVVKPTVQALPARDEPEVPGWFTDADAPTLKIERTQQTHDAVITCGSRRLRLAPLTRDAQRTLLGATPFSTPPVELHVTLSQTVSGLRVAVVTATDHLGRDYVIVEIGGVEVDDVTSSEVRAKSRAELFDENNVSTARYMLVGGAEVRIDMGRMMYKPSPRSLYEMGMKVPDEVAEPIHTRLKATMRSRLPTQTTHAPMVGPCTELLND